MLKRFDLSEDFAGFYRENGYVILTNLLTHDELARARSEIFDLFETFFRGSNKKNLRGSELLTFYYESEKEAWRRCAKRMYDLLGVYSLAAKAQIAEALKRLGLQTPIVSSRPEVRTDMPKDEQYTQPWHQDWRYGQGSLNSITIWMPLHDVTVANGTIEVIPGSHLMGYLETEELSNPRRFSIIDRQIEAMDHFPLELAFGEVVAFSQMMVHRSGYNRTEAPRLSVQMRFLDYSEPLFLENDLPSPFSSSEMLWKRQPSADDMRQYFGTW